MPTKNEQKSKKEAEGGGRMKGAGEIPRKNGWTMNFEKIFRTFDFEPKLALIVCSR